MMTHSFPSLLKVLVGWQRAINVQSNLLLKGLKYNKKIVQKRKSLVLTKFVPGLIRD